MKEQDMKKQEKPDGGKSEGGFTGQYFLLFVIILYIILYLFDSDKTIDSLRSSGELLYSILPILLFVIMFMTLIFWLIKPQLIKKYMGKGSGLKGWAIALATGILSHGPLYVWYPMLRDLREHGMKNSLISVFLSNRSVKLPFLPMMVFYFGGLFVLILVIYMILASLVQGWIFEILERSGIVMENTEN